MEFKNMRRIDTLRYRCKLLPHEYNTTMNRTVLSASNPITTSSFNDSRQFGLFSYTGGGDLDGQPAYYQSGSITNISDGTIKPAYRNNNFRTYITSIGFSTKGNFHFDTKNEPDNKFIVNAPNIYLGIENLSTGKLPTEPAVLGHELETLLIEILDFLEMLVLDVCYNIAGLSTVPGTPTGMNPANSTILNLKMTEINNIKNNIKSIMSANTKLV